MRRDWKFDVVIARCALTYNVRFGGVCDQCFGLGGSTSCTDIKGGCDNIAAQLHNIAHADLNGCGVTAKIIEAVHGMCAAGQNLEYLFLIVVLVGSAKGIGELNAVLERLVVEIVEVCRFGTVVGYLILYHNRIDTVHILGKPEAFDRYREGADISAHGSSDKSARFGCTVFGQEIIGCFVTLCVAALILFP